MPRALCRDCCELVETAADVCSVCGSGRLVAHAELETLAIGHIDCDAFYASVEKRDRPELRDQPLIVGHASGRGVVTTACYIARTFGVRSAMPMFKAMDLCPNAVVLSPDMAKYKRVSSDIRAIFEAETPVFEPLSLDEAYLDLSAEHRQAPHPAALSLARIARNVEQQIGITVSIGLSCNKFLAKLASELDKPRGFSVIGAAEAKAFLAPLSIRKINGVGAATAARLEAEGIMTIGQLQTLSEVQLVTQYGKLGRRLAHFAHGQDDRAVTSHRSPKSISAETTFRRDTGSAADLCAAARPLGESVAAHLQRKGLACATVVLKLKTSDFRILTRSQRLPHPTQRAQAVLEAALHLIGKEADGRMFRLIGIGASELRPAAEADPPDLFGMLSGRGS